MVQFSRTPVAVLALALIVGCASPDPATSTAERFDAAFGDLSAQYGDGKADLFRGFGPDPCTLIEPVLSDAGVLPMGLIAGVVGEGALGLPLVIGGVDLVWDLYHHQFYVTSYAGGGLRTPAVGATVGAQVGMVFNLQNGVSDYSGFFVTSVVTLGLPFLRDYLSLGPEMFVSGDDLNGDFVIGPSEMNTPPDGVYGFGLALDVGFNLLPDPLPVGAMVTESKWQQHATMTRRFYDDFAASALMSVHLVDDWSGAPCDPEWPAVNPDQVCVVQFGDVGQSHTRRGLYTAYSICRALDNCITPVAWPAAGITVAMGAVQDASGGLREVCPGSMSGL